MSRESIKSLYRRIEQANDILESCNRPMRLGHSSGGGTFQVTLATVGTDCYKFLTIGSASECAHFVLAFIDGMNVIRED